MNESGRKKREWVKTAAIVFLSVMLVLTFFSSTIQNWSLPEVATQYVQSGTITAKANITGTVESVDPYEVKVTESRKVASVAVRTGMEVQKGDVLVYLEDRDSKELDEAKKALKAAQAEYDSAILSDKYTSSDISDANQGVTSEKYRDQISRAQSAVEAAEKAVKAAETAVKDGEAALKATEQFEGTVTEPLRTQLETVETQINDRQQTIDYIQNISTNASKELSEAKDERDSAERELNTAKSELNSTRSRMEAARDRLNQYTGTDAAEKKKLEDELREAEDAFDEAENSYDYWEPIFEEAEKEYISLKKVDDDRSNQILSLKGEITQLEMNKYNIQKQLSQLEEAAKGDTESMQKQLDAKKEQLDARSRELEEKKEALTERVNRAGNVTGLQKYLDAIKDAQKLVDELTEKAGGTTITAPISGTVTAVNVTAGNETSTTTPVVVMQREGQGFTLKYSATNEVAKKLSVGDVGSLVNAWRYDDVTVTLASIQPDPDSRGQNKLLTFNVTGSVVAGQSLSFTIGQKSSNYNFIVPNSAIREDNNGKFILIVVSKGSPLGTRYTASRVDVQVIASDETQSAVSGALGGYEFVITTSTKPVEAGNLVRLPD